MDRHGTYPEPSSQPDAYSMQGYGAAVGSDEQSPYHRYQPRLVHLPVNAPGIHEPNVASQNAYGNDYPINSEYGYQNVANTQYTGFPTPGLDFTYLDGYLNNNPFVPASIPSQPLNARLLAAPINAVAPIAAPDANTQYTGFPVAELGFTQFENDFDNNPSRLAPAFVGHKQISAGPVDGHFQDRDAEPVVVPTTAPINAAATIAASASTRRLPCTHAGCTHTLQHQHDLTRHMKGHRTGAKDFNCPYRDCPRQGVNGFTRKDKLMDHLKGKHKW